MQENEISQEAIVAAAVKASEEQGAPAEVASLDDARKASHTEGFSKTAMKMIRRQSKDQLVHQVVQLNNYAENQKAANMLLMYKLKTLDEAVKQLSELNEKLKSELLTFRPESAVSEPAAEQLEEK